ncbi:hypothetical protein SASPL_122651 [Salvia splendens]|uniref:Uncharacterized protein n=1 Tax=Salvia splendens TaxID=180675 RepID=A0A8X8XIT3_SALSN|nr:uncharacterized protein LOC121743768 [Salvia splendens]KAG6415245.1 hypothetical protein SASPL_122651 [Salvia splendens]
MLPSHLPSAADPPRLSQDICSTPFVSAPSSPAHSAHYYSAPPTPMHFDHPVFLTTDSASFEFEFEFSSRFSPTGNLPNASMTSADELFFNGQIRPMKQLHSGGGDLKFSHRKARSMSPAVEYEWRGFSSSSAAGEQAKRINESAETTPSCSASTSRSSSSGRNSKKWMFLKDLLLRSKSEGRGNMKERFWSISFSSPSSSRDAKNETKRGTKAPVSGKPANGVWRRRVPQPSAHELHYTANRAQAEEMKKKTFLPYRQDLLGCLGFSSKSYVAFAGSFTTNRNPISSA